MVELDKKNIEQKLFSSDYKFEDSSVFKELMNLYPWCSSFTVVYLKSLSLTNDMRFQKELENYAVQLNSREVIYDLLHTLNSIDIEDQPLEEESLNVVVEKKAEDQEVKNTIDSEKTNQNDEDDELEKLIVSNVISENLIKEIEEESEKKESSKEIEKKKESQSKGTGDVIEVQFNDSPKSFNDWLRQGTKNTGETSDKEYLTFEKPKANFFNPQESAKKSITKKDLPVSETLAKVFESQGNFPLAISTYEQLILIFPEKKIFFADQIEKIKSKII